MTQWFGGPTRKFCAVVTALGIMSTGMPPILAHETKPKAHVGVPSVSAAEWAIEFLDANGNVVRPTERRSPAPVSVAPSSTLSPTDIQRRVEEVRAKVVALSESSDPYSAKLGKRLLKWLDIATAKTAAQRHEAIRRLPVTVKVGHDEQSRTVKTFFAEGKPRLRVSSPVRAALEPTQEPHPTIEFLQDRGPSASEAVLTDPCYDNEEPPCLTWEEMEDLGIVIAQQAVENEMYEAELNAAQAEMEAFCNQYPWECSNEEEIASAGPCAAFDPCGEQAGYAIGNGLLAVGAWTASYVMYTSAWTAGLGLSAALATGAVATMAGSALVFGVAVFSYVNCKNAKVYEPQGSRLRQPLQPLVLPGRP
jgi:hypothetical protein